MRLQQEPTVALLLPAACFLGAGEMSARVGRSGSERKPAVEMKPQETVLYLSLPTWEKAKANPVPRFCMQPRNVGLVGAPHRFPMTSIRVSSYFHVCNCLRRSGSAASRGRSSSAHETAFASTSRTIQGSVGAVNDESDPEWIRAERCFDGVDVLTRGWAGGDGSSNGGLHI